MADVFFVNVKCVYRKVGGCLFKFKMKSSAVDDSFMGNCCPIDRHAVESDTLNEDCIGRRAVGCNDKLSTGGQIVSDMVE